MKSLFISLSLLALLCLSCNSSEKPNQLKSNANQENIELAETSDSKLYSITIAKEKPKYFGSTGLHLYAVSPIDSSGTKKIILDNTCEAVDLYKLYYDLAIFLSDEKKPNPFGSSMAARGIFGNPKHQPSISSNKYVRPEYQIVGYLDKSDVAQFVEFLAKHELGKLEGVKRYYESRSQDVKDELNVLQGKNLITELHSYLQRMNTFYKQCEMDEKEILLLVNA